MIKTRTMKKTLLTAILIIAISQYQFAQGVLAFSVPKIEGGSQNLSAFQGKKLLVITLPVQQNAAADSFLYSLDTLSRARATILKVIAVPSAEDGCTAANQSQLRQWYRSKLGNQIVITAGLRTRKTSGNQQHSLFQWLTKDTQNQVFDIDADAPGFKFFTKGNGTLYGVLGPVAKINGLTVKRALQIQ
jgi:glutathione peroxidase-family protein